MNWLTRFESWMGYQPIIIDPLEDVVLLWDDKNKWTLRDSFEGTIIFGANGSGKTSGSGKSILRALMRRGFGGLVLSVKGDEWKTCCNLAQETGRGNDLIRFTLDPAANCCYNPLENETKTENAVRLLLTLVDLSSIGQRAKDDDGFWKDELQKLLRHSVELLRATVHHIDLYDLEKLITTTPSDLAEVESKRDKLVHYVGIYSIRFQPTYAKN